MGGGKYTNIGIYSTFSISKQTKMLFPLQTLVSQCLLTKVHFQFISVEWIFFFSWFVSVDIFLRKLKFNWSLHSTVLILPSLCLAVWPSIHVAGKLLLLILAGFTLKKKNSQNNKIHFFRREIKITAYFDANIRVNH